MAVARFNSIIYIYILYIYIYCIYIRCMYICLTWFSPHDPQYVPF